MSTFKIGEKVVCVDDTNQDTGHTVIGAGKVKLNEIYTVDGFNYINGLILKEVSCGVFKYGGKIGGFKPSRFRKLDYQFAENLLAELTQSAKSEYQLN